MQNNRRTKKAVPRRESGAIKSLVDALGVTRSRVHQMLRDGMPGDVAGALTWRSQRQAHELKEARLAVLSEQRRKLEIDNKTKEGALLPAAEVDERDTRIGFAMRAALMGLEHSLPPRLAGLSEPQIARVLHDDLHHVLEQLADEQSAFWARPA